VARKLKSDKGLFIATILLVGLSIVMVYSASAPLALQKYGRASMFLVRQGMWALLGLSMLYIVMRIDYRRYREPAFIWTCLVFVILALIAVLFSSPVNGARRWFGVGGIGIQPSELAKLASIFFMSTDRPPSAADALTGLAGRPISCMWIGPGPTRLVS
jgi:cell division protein FtsW